MKRIYLLTLILLYASTGAASPTPRHAVYDSVHVATLSRTPQERFAVMEAFADSLLDTQPYDAIPFTREAARLAHERGDKNEEGYLLNSLSKCYLSLGDFVASGEYARRALVFNLEVKHDFEVARTYSITAVTYTYMGLYTNAMEYSLKALKIYETLRKPASAASMMNSIGTIYLRLSNYAMAREYFHRSLAMSQRKDTSKFRILVLNNLASVHTRAGMPDSALVLLEPLLRVSRARHDRGAEAYTLFNLGEAYREKKMYDSAVAYLRRAREASTEIREAHGEAEAALGIARAYAENGKHRQVLAALDDAIPYCTRVRTFDLLREALTLQLQAYERIGDLRRAYAAMKSLTTLTDSVFTIADKFGVANAVFAADLGEKEGEISRLRHEAVVNEMSIKNKQSQIHALAAFILLFLSAIIGLLYIYGKSNRLRIIEIEQKNKIAALYDELSSVVADRKQADEHARESQEKFKAVWENALDGMRLTDADGTVLMVNQAFCRMAGMEREAMTGKPLSVIYDPSVHEQIVQLYRERFASRSVEAYFERELMLKDGKSMWFEVTNSFIDIADQPPLLLGIFRDVSVRKTLEHQLVQSQKLEGIGTLAGGIAHDFNNLLAMILGSAELLQRQIAGQPALQTYVDRIVEASSRGASISRQLLIFSRPDRAQLKPISLSQTIGELQEMLKHFLPRSIIIKTIIETTEDVIMGDAGQIHQALLNLAMNAGDAMADHGTIVIREFYAAPEVLREKFPHAAPSRSIGLSICDTGVGMTDEVKRKMFDPFFTTKEREKGTGLGLSSVHGIVKNHDGLIDVASEPGRGTIVTIYFPAAPAALPEPPAEPLPAQAHDARRILLVDDEKIIRETMEELLLACGYAVQVASGGAEALEIFRERPGMFDLVITDLGMPEMGGEELYLKLRAIDPLVKVIVSSGYLDGTTIDELVKLGVKDVLAKPVRINDLQAAIRSALQST